MYKYNTQLQRKRKKIRRNQFCKSNTKINKNGNTQKHPVVQKLQHYPWDKLAISYKAYSTESQQGCPEVYLLVLYMCVQIRVWSCLVTDNFGLSTEIAVCKFLHGLVVVWLEPFFILSIVCVCTYFCLLLYGALCCRPCKGS